MRNLWRHLTRPAPASDRSQGTTAHAFPGLGEAEVVRLHNRAIPRRLAPGETLFLAGSRAEQLYAIETGTIALGDPTDGEHFGPGEWIGEFDLDRPGLHAATATALTASQIQVLALSAIADLDPGLRTYLERRVHQLNLQRLYRLQRRQAALARHDEALTEALIAARTSAGAGFAETETARQLFAKVPALPVSTTTLLNKMLDERTTKGEIVELVTMDPALTSTLLKSVNSPYYALQHQITSVSHAIALLGHNAVYQVIMTESMRHSLPNTELFADIHQRAIELSRLAFTLAQTLAVGRPAEIATLGILADIGLVINALLKRANPRLQPLFDLLDPAEMGAALLRSWHLPAMVCDSLHHQHHPEFAPPARLPEPVRDNVAVLYLARRLLARLHGHTPSDPGLFLEAYLALLGRAGISEVELLYEQLVPRLRAQLRQLPRSLAERLDG
ncbi:HDOD domain-containing protein [Marichromatium bheemlicum]|uniref:HDOD domain-containing protein n=1 Tax=Marichromatium bheemlicum TaxID=365339 RepID=A0ABX1IDY0_9GAMM|nr:HDOD domain-containing protein [Marichromatium bheemlicum]NKN34377.1 HDOD domain-containing protein [Marichromatium bheemlicum]